MNKIKAIGLTTTELSLDGKPFTQYSILVYTMMRYQEYVFTPNENKQYAYRVNPMVDKTVEMKVLSANTYLYWKGRDLYIVDDENEQPLLVQNTFRPPTDFFIKEELTMPPRTVLLLHKQPELLPFFDAHNNIAYTDEWHEVPSSIPEDIIVIGEKEFPIKDILLHLPPNTTILGIKSYSINKN